jgi:hypothetical protein
MMQHRTYRGHPGLPVRAFNHQSRNLLKNALVAGSFIHKLKNRQVFLQTKYRKTV